MGIPAGKRQPPYEETYLGDGTHGGELVGVPGVRPLKALCKAVAITTFFLVWWPMSELWTLVSVDWRYLGGDDISDPRKRFAIAIVGLVLLAATVGAWVVGFNGWLIAAYSLFLVLTLLRWADL